MRIAARTSLGLGCFGQRPPDFLLLAGTSASFPAAEVVLWKQIALYFGFSFLSALRGSYFSYFFRENFGAEEHDFKNVARLHRAWWPRSKFDLDDATASEGCKDEVVQGKLFRFPRDLT
jgi:hypothetical protein